MNDLIANKKTKLWLDIRQAIAESDDTFAVVEYNPFNGEPFASLTHDGIDRCATIAEAVAQNTVIERLVEALEGLLGCGRKDHSNPKYDGYYEEARAAIAEILSLS